MLVAALLLAVGLAVAAVFFLLGQRSGERRAREQSRTELDEIARTTAERVVGPAVERFRDATRSDRDIGQEQLQRVAEPIQKSLDRVMEVTRELEARRAEDSGANAETTKELTRLFAEAKSGVQSVRDALKGDRQARGRWGETQLENLVEITGLRERLDFDAQAGANGVRPDLVLRLPHGTKLAIDAKAPMDDYLATTEESDPGRREAALKRHARKVRSHTADLARRAYPRQLGDGPPFTVMFLPIESLLAEAIRHDDGLLQFAADRNIVLATPHTLLGLLWAVAAMWRHEEGTRNAEAMRKAGIEIEERLSIFLNHFADVGKRLGATTDAFNSAVGSSQGRLTPQLRKLRELGGMPEDGTGKTTIPEPVEVVPRTVRREEEGDRAGRPVRAAS